MRGLGDENPLALFFNFNFFKYMITIDGINFYDENFGVTPDGTLKTGSYNGKATKLCNNLIPEETDKEIYDKDCTSIEIAEGDITLEAGDFVNLHINVSPVSSNVPEIIWESSDIRVAFVTSSGIVRALTEGEATITATNSENTNISDSIVVTVS